METKHNYVCGECTKKFTIKEVKQVVEVDDLLLHCPDCDIELLETWGDAPLPIEDPPF